MRIVSKVIVVLMLIGAGLAPATSWAQKVTISGYVKDSASGEDLSGAYVYIKSLNVSTSSNAYGRFVLETKPGKYELQAYAAGFQPFKVSLKISSKDTVIRIDMAPKVSAKTVTINSGGSQATVETTQMSKIDVSVEQVKNLPALFGEVDILKTLQLLPGVQSGSEGSTGFFVRGGGPDQNLILLDEAVVYNASHLFGFFSVFNSDAIKNFELYKGGFPAKYGGRLSSVVDVNLKEGNKKGYHGAGGIGLIASRFTFEGPIKKDKGSFIVSGRRTYIDVFTNLANEANKDNATYTPIPGYYFYDANLKANYEIDSNNRVFLSGYFGRDVFNFSQSNFDFGFNWGNATGTARFNHIYSSRLFSNSTITFSNYDYAIENKGGSFRATIGSSIQDWTVKHDFDYSLNSKHNIKFGASYIYHTFGVGKANLASTDNDVNINFDDKRFGSEFGFYAGDDWDASEKLKINYGLRYSGFGNTRIFYDGWEPRFSARYKLTPTLSLKGSYTGTQQYVQLVSNSGASLPTDIWYPSTEKVKPQYAQQIAIGAASSRLGDDITITDEVFYKWMNNQIDYKNGADLFFNNNLDDEFVFGKGWAYGNEFMIQKTQGRWTGWIGYTYLMNWRQFDRGTTAIEKINNGEPFHPKYDTRHSISTVASYEITDKITVSATWVYNTGNLTTLPDGGYAVFQDIPGGVVGLTPVYTNRNNYRMAPYHRLDLSVVFKKKTRWGESDWTVSVYNAYNRYNPFFINIESAFNPDSPLPISNTARQVSLFPIIPSVTYNFKF